VPAETSLTRSAARRRRTGQSRLALRRAVALAAVLGVLVLAFSLAYAGSRTRLADGTTIAGVDVGGLTATEATQALRSRAAALVDTPVVFVAPGYRLAIDASKLGIVANWHAAVEAAQDEGDGFGPVRGLRRIHTRLFGAQVAPSVTVFDAALEHELDKIAQAVDRPSVDARLRRHGLHVAVVPGRDGRRLDRDAAADTIVRTLASLERPASVTLSVASTAPRVSAADLGTAAAEARTALSAPVRLTYGGTRWRLPRWRIPDLLTLPRGGATELAVAGKGADSWFRGLARTIDRKPTNATFAVFSGGIRVVPAKPGRELDVTATARALQAALVSETDRTAGLVVRVAQPERSTAEARAMGIDGVVGSYTTTYGGTPGRVHNVQLVAELIDGTLVGPGTTFSFNGTTGERNASRGFQEAPVIINGELQTGIGGGVCQVSTTVFNAAYEAGLPIVERTNHALYISHYPTGRDATVNYPDLDLRFTNDTGKWLLVRTFVNAGSLTVNLYGTPQERRVETEAAPLVETGEVPVEEVADPELLVGERVTESVGQPPRETSVRRLVYDADGSLLYDTTWRSYYSAEPTIVRVGTKEQPKPPKGKAKGKKAKAGPAKPAQGEAGRTAPAATAPAETVPATTTPTPSPTPLP
jgi:vancomycin resistance protein YoaR